MAGNLQDTLQKIEGHLRLIAFVVAFAMLGGIIYLKMSDEGPKMPPTPQTPPPAQLDHKRDVAQAIEQEIGRSEAPIEKSALRNLIADDMFSLKNVLANTQAAKKADEKVAEAEKAKAGGNLQEARRLYQEALAIFPQHYDATNRLKSLEAQMGIASGATTSTATVAPAGKPAEAPIGVAVPRPSPAAARPAGN